MSGALIVRPEGEADWLAIGALLSRAFAAHPHSTHSEHRLVEALRQAGALEASLVAEQAAVVVGYVAFSAVNIGDGTAGWYGLGPVAVEPACQRRGIGRALIEAGLAQLCRHGARGCVVLGDPVYYQLLGFRAVTELSLPGAPEGAFMELFFGSHRPRGEVTYHAAFSGA